MYLWFICSHVVILVGTYPQAQPDVKVLNSVWMVNGWSGVSKKRRKFGLGTLHDYVENRKLELRSLWENFCKTQNISIPWAAIWLSSECTGSNRSKMCVTRECFYPESWLSLNSIYLLIKGTETFIPQSVCKVPSCVLQNTLQHDSEVDINLCFSKLLQNRVQYCYFTVEKGGYCLTMHKVVHLLLLTDECIMIQILVCSDI